MPFIYFLSKIILKLFQIATENNYLRRNESEVKVISSKEQLNILHQHYSMLYPSTLRENEYVRLVAIRKDKTGNPVSSKVSFVKSFEEYIHFVQKYRYTHDVYNQLATNRGNEEGTKSSQRQRKVLYLDFDGKDYPNMHDAAEFTKMIKDKLPKMFLHSCVSSGHGFHFYISIKPTCKIDDVVSINKDLVSILGADMKATSPTQIARVPCTYNHKLDDGTYDYSDREKWNYVKVVNNTYMVGKQFRTFDLSYVRKQMNYFAENQDAMQMLDKVRWQYESLDEYPCYLCVRKILNEGADEGQRNFWHGRIVKLLQMEGYRENKIYSMCQEWNTKCRPPKTPKVIEEDTERYLKFPGKLLGCYECFPEGDTKREWVESQCDKVYCGTYHNGAKISIEEGESAKINKKILTNRELRYMTGNEYLIITLLDVYSNSFGRKGFRVKNLKEFLYSSVQKKQCINDRLLRELLLKLSNDRVDGKKVMKKWIELTPDKKSKSFDDYRLKLTRRLKEFQQGYIEFYFSIAGALIDGRITQKEYIVFITLVRNLSNKKSVTYDQLAEDLEIDKSNIGKYIKKLQKERCLIVEKDYTEKGYEFNKYHIVSPDFFRDKSNDDGTPFNEQSIKVIPDEEEKTLKIKLIA